MAKYFKEAEFRACMPPCNMRDLRPGFLDKLDEIRERAGIPLVLNSAFRSVSYEKSKGRSGTSAHCLGCAADIRCNTPANRFRIVKAAIAAGITRIGIGKTYIHLDNSVSHPQHVIWDYYE